MAPDAPGKLLADSFAYEFVEIAAYGMLGHLAQLAGDAATEAAAAGIRADEEQMASRLAAQFDWAVAATREQTEKDVDAAVRAHLRDAYALETQTEVLLALGSLVAGSPTVTAYHRTQRLRTRRQRHRIAARLGRMGTRPGLTKAAAMTVGGAAWGLLWAAQRYTPAKLNCFLYAAQHLEIASYELLRREAAGAQDTETEGLAAQLLDEEQAAAEELAGMLTTAADAAVA